MEQLIVNGVAYNATPAEAAPAQQSEELAGNVEKMQINGQVYDIRDVEDVEALDSAKLTVTQVEWGDGKYLYNFLVGATYHIRGTRTNVNDDLPMSEAGDNATIDAQLLVLESSIKSDDGSANRECITQVLTLSNRLAGSGDVYVRTGIGRNKGAVTFGAWRQLGAGGGSAAIEAQAPLAQKNGKLSLNIGNGLKVEDNKLVAIPQSSSDTSNALRALFIAAGAEYNDSGVDIIKTTPWAAFVDDIEYKAQNNIDVLNYTTVDLHSIVQDGTTYQYVVDNGVYKVVGRASRGQIVHDERYCIHRAGHYYLNGLGDITEEQMLTIYNRTATPVNKYISYFRMQNESDLPYIPRTNILSDAFFAGMTFENLNSAFYASPIEVFKACGSNDRTFAAIPEFGVATLSSTFERSQMKYLIGALNIKKQSTTDTQYFGGNAPNLRVLLFKNLCGNLKTFNTAANISKSSILYAINNSAATSAITITLHANAYARLKDNPEVVAALANKPLVTLVSA